MFSDWVLSVYYNFCLVDLRPCWSKSSPSLQILHAGAWMCAGCARKKTNLIFVKCIPSHPNFGINYAVGAFLRVRGRSETKGENNWSVNRCRYLWSRVCTLLPCIANFVWIAKLHFHTWGCVTFREKNNSAVTYYSFPHLRLQYFSQYGVFPPLFRFQFPVTVIFRTSLWSASVQIKSLLLFFYTFLGIRYSCVCFFSLLSSLRFLLM